MKVVQNHVDSNKLGWDEASDVTPCGTASSRGRLEADFYCLGVGLGIQCLGLGLVLSSDVNVGGSASSSFCLYLVRPFSFLSRGSHYCGGQSRAGASTLSHTPGRTNRKTQ